MKGYPVNRIVREVGELAITGNVVPISWGQTILSEKGKPYAIAMLLLADIVYWYRPIEVRDEETGKLCGLRKKFKADKLQRSYEAFAEQYGFTKNQVRAALKRLERLGVIDLDFRNFHVAGTRLGNVLFIGLKVGTLKALTHRSEKDFTPMKEFSHRAPSEIAEGLQNIEGGVEEFAETNTEIPQILHSHFPETTAALAAESKNAHFAENHALLEAEGLNGKNLTALAAIPFLTPANIRDAVTECKAKDGGPGLLTNILRELRPPETEESRRRKYTGGAFGEFVNH